MTTKNEKVQRAASVGTAIGNIGGLTYAFIKKKKFWPEGPSRSISAQFLSERTTQAGTKANVPAKAFST